MNQAQDKISRYWIKNFSSLEDVLNGGLVYMDLVRKKKQEVFQITVSSHPFSNDTPEKFNDWRNNKIVVFEVSFSNKKKNDSNIYDIWEAHSIAAILTISGYEVMIGNEMCEVSTYSKFSHRTSDLSSNTIDEWRNSSQGKDERVENYSDYTDVLCSKRREYEISGELADKDTVRAFGDNPQERFVGSTSNELLFEEGM